MNISRSSFRIFAISFFALCAEMASIYFLVPNQTISVNAGKVIAVLAIITATVCAAALIFGVAFPPIARAAYRSILTEDQKRYLLNFKFWRIILDVEETESSH